MAIEAKFSVNLAYAYICYFYLQKTMRVNEKHQVIVDLILSGIEPNYHPAYNDRPVTSYLQELNDKAFKKEMDGSIYFTKDKNFTTKAKNKMLENVPITLKTYLMTVVE